MTTVSAEFAAAAQFRAVAAAEVNYRWAREAVTALEQLPRTTSQRAALAAVGALYDEAVLALRDACAGLSNNDSAAAIAAGDAAFPSARQES